MSWKDSVSIEEWMFYWLFGKPKRRVSVFELKESKLQELEPVFFLSTGRAGTKWFTDLLSHDKRSVTLHDPYPNLALQNRFAYEEIMQGRGHEALQQIIWTARENYFRHSYKSGKRIIETNSSITFFAPILSEMFPKSKFVHLVRNPVSFVKSGYNRGYYSDHPQEARRIMPCGAELESWRNFDQIEKISWLWKETNRFVRDFGSNLEGDRFLTFNFEDLTLERIKDVIHFIDVEISDKQISRAIAVPKNVQKQKKASLSESVIGQIHRICDAEAKHYEMK